MVTKFLSSKKALFSIALFGLVVVVIAAKNRTAPERSDSLGQPGNAEYIVASPQQNSPLVRGYGIVEPSVRINKLAEVSGRVIYVHPQLLQGAVLEKGTVVVRIDDTDYRLAFRQAEANVAVNQARLAELEENKASLERNLQLVNEKLEFSRKELKRKQVLRNKKSVSQSLVDADRVKVLQLEQEKTSLQQQLATLPSERNILLAQLDSSKAQVHQQQRNIERTEITMPITGRISLNDIEQEQFASVGQTLFQVHGIEQVDIEAQFTLEEFAPFLELFASQQTAISTLTSESINSFIRHTQLSAMVSLPVTPDELWPGKVIAIGEQLDPQSRTIGVLVRVDHPYKNITPGKRPPLIDGMHVEVAVKGTPLHSIALPQKAMQQGHIYLADNNDKLKKIAITPLLIMDEVALFNGEAIAEGSRVITSDLVPAIEGMEMTLTLDQMLQDELTGYSVSKEL